MDLLSHVEPLPMDRLLPHEARLVRKWPPADRDQLLEVAHRDVHVALHNVAEMTRYINLHSAQLSACAGTMDATLPLMTVETLTPLATVRIRVRVRERHLKCGDVTI